ncbi:MAG: ergothioneine biosynthesis protein EgtB [Chakrabartia sp.]
MKPAQARAAGEAMLARYRRVRAISEALSAPLSAEDCQVQSMPDASPVKWHLAHSSWFFDRFLLTGTPEGRRASALQDQLYNSYYTEFGTPFARAQRGLVSRPALQEVIRYRRLVDSGMAALIAERPSPEILELVELGCQHEQQHQELILTDIKHLLFVTPAQGAYAASEGPLPATSPTAWRTHKGGLVDIGHDGRGFGFDNEQPRHSVWLEPFALASHLVTAGDYAAFIADGGYRRAALWLSDGWDICQSQNWTAPLYWQEGQGQWTRFTLGGRQSVDPRAPVTHISFYEADAFARWAGHRLPREAEWEAGASLAGMEQLYDAAWQWTASAYLAYPGYRPAAGAVGEYNGKFMSNRMVLRGGSALTPTGHARRSYRNFFAPETRWQMAGLRLAAGP